MDSLSHSKAVKNSLGRVVSFYTGCPSFFLHLNILMWYAGIDYSMTSPAMCMYHATDDKYRWYYMSTTKSKLKESHNLQSALIDVPKSVQQDLLEGSIDASMSRYNQISDYFMRTLDVLQPKMVFIEGYSLGSVGKVFSIAENTAILKQKLYDNGHFVSVFPPTVVKKFATGKGNASKTIMREQFLKPHKALKTLLVEQRVKDLHKVTHYVDSPMSDLIDAYFICRYGVHLLQHRGFADDKPASQYHTTIENLDLDS